MKNRSNKGLGLVKMVRDEAQQCCLVSTFAQWPPCVKTFCHATIRQVSV